MTAATGVAIVTNVDLYAGPPSAAALAADGFDLLCHCAAFADPAARDAHEVAFSGQTAASARTSEELVAEAVRRFGRLDVVVSNDAAPVRRAPVTDPAALDDLRQMIEMLTITPFRLAAAAAAVMVPQASGRIVFITSGGPLRPPPLRSPYLAARGATNALAKALAVELGPAGIAVNAIAPYMLQSHYLPGGMDDPEIARSVGERIPMQRLGRPEEIGALVSLLASGKADFVSGQVIALSGGAV